ncbi:hypothetical protein Z517_10081 [Fonsecaea pedrosoi CBS 271.37]|uniref:Uncharacterized protein n=1 Tax=Fonsecaea pedrosoi CBS 271.37 TaxID=1442368 RepID=A0A0D2G951_9EURO|nr:uncharacterized protein Z517_10081 [Fonsecaea pedrosoi CBS 271.37]KIW75340.1 hypothetical protein Z517_10081 [Fonsecaea pedrosoi CBS 271.37]
MAGGPSGTSRVDACKNPNDPEPRYSDYSRHFTNGVTCVPEFWGSFAFRIVWLAFVQIYDIINVFSTSAESRGCTGNMNEVGFGEIISLVLLVSPLMAAIEARDDYNDKKSRQKHDRKENLASEEGNETSSIAPEPAPISSTVTLPSAVEALSRLLTYPT